MRMKRKKMPVTESWKKGILVVQWQKLSGVIGSYMETTHA